MCFNGDKEHSLAGVIRWPKAKRVLTTGTQCQFYFRYPPWLYDSGSLLFPSGVGGEGKSLNVPQKLLAVAVALKRGSDWVLRSEEPSMGSR